MMSEEEGTEVANGKHAVPRGVAVEELDGGKKRLRDECPDDLRTLLDKKGLFDAYDRFVKAIVEEGNTRNVFGRWRDKEFDSILDLFRDDFAEKGVRVALCKRKSGKAQRRWIEFIDVDEAPDYVPQYDVANTSGQVIRTVYSKLEFPYGVAVEELKQWGHARKRLKEKIPVHVELLLEQKDLRTEYDALVNDCAELGVGKRFKFWNTGKLTEVIKGHNTGFEAKGVSIFVSQKKEWVQHGQSGHVEIFRWIEFVDRDLQPNYHPQRDVELKG